MVRFLWSVAVNLVSAAVGVLLATLMLPDFRVEWNGILVAVIVLTIAQAVLAPFVFNLARKYASALLGGIGIVSTMLALFIASLFPGGVHVTTFATWVVAALIIWIVMALGGWLLLGWVLKRFVKDARAGQ
ncbi:MAG: phage holin family protein [Propionibacteriaceae bacterium]|jgi:uncharacterized membrane protein YvlD (DUF360 family)|nr:phage holin family protein [Propionibacteriaceae bacterium]